MAGCGDVRVVQVKPVLCTPALRLVGEAGQVKGAVQEVAGTVSRKHAARAVGAMGSGGKSEEKDAGVRIAERGHGPAPVGFVLVGSSLYDSHVSTMVDQAAAQRAIRDFGLEQLQWTQVLP